MGRFVIYLHVTTRIRLWLSYPANVISLIGYLVMWFEISETAVFLNFCFFNILTVFIDTKNLCLSFKMPVNSNGMLRIFSYRKFDLIGKCFIYLVKGIPKTRKLFQNYYAIILLFCFSIVAVGGDGMYSECVNGLLERLQSDAQIDIHDPQAQIRASKISIGIIPAGNYIFFSINICLTCKMYSILMYIIIRSLGDQRP